MYSKVYKQQKKILGNNNYSEETSRKLFLKAMVKNLKWKFFSLLISVTDCV